MVEPKTDPVHVAMIISCTLSLLGASFILLSFFLFKELRQVPSRRLLAILSFCDMLVAIAYLLPGPAGSSSHHPTEMCKAQAAINIFSNEASFFWTACIAVYVFLSHKYGIRIANKFIIGFHIVSWGVPTLITVVVGVGGHYGLDDNTAANWCWISPDQQNLYLILAGKGTEWFCCLFITVMYLCVYLDVHSKVATSPGAQLLLNQNAHANWKKTEKKLLAIPLILLFLRFPGSLRTVLTLSNHTHAAETLSLKMFQAVGDSIQGFANGLIFGIFTDKVLKSYTRLYMRLLSRCGFYRYEVMAMDDDDTGARTPPSLPTMINP